MEYTGYENLTDEQIEDKLRSLETIKYNLEREQRHRKETEERKKYEDIIGKFFLLKGVKFNEESGVIFEIKSVEEDKYVGKHISFSSSAGKTLMPSTSAIHIVIEPHFVVTNLDNYEEISKEDVDEILKGWKRHINIYTKF